MLSKKPNARKNMPTQTTPQLEPSNLLVAVATKLELLHNDLGEVKQTQDKMAEAIGKLAVIEERQYATNESLTRAFNDIKSLKDTVVAQEGRLREVESVSGASQKTSKWVEMGLLGIVMVVLQFVAKKVGLI